MYLLLDLHVHVQSWRTCNVGTYSCNFISSFLWVHVYSCIKRNGDVQVHMLYTSSTKPKTIYWHVDLYNVEITRICLQRPPAFVHVHLCSVSDKGTCFIYKSWRIYCIIGMYRTHLLFSTCKCWFACGRYITLNKAHTECTYIVAVRHSFSLCGDTSILQSQNIWWILTVWWSGLKLPN